MTQRLVVKIATGAADLERFSQGLMVATTAAMSGVPTSLWLAGEATWLAVPERSAEFDLPDLPNASEQLAELLGVGTVKVCARCAARRNLVEADLAPGVTIAGAASFVAEATTDATQALVY